MVNTANQRKPADRERPSIGTPTVFEEAIVLTVKLKRDGLSLVNEFLRESGTGFR